MCPKKNVGRLSGKVALITGAKSGIGKACVKRFVEEGASVVAADISVPDSYVGDTGSILKISGDVTKSGDAAEMVNKATQTYGKLDILVNSAGISSRNAFEEDADPEKIWDRVIEVNLKGTYLVSRYAVPEMELNGSGSIINLASINGLVGYPVGIGGGFNAYPPSKGGVIQFTKTLANDMASKNVRVNCLCPGYVETNLTESLTNNESIYQKLKNLHPMGRLGRPEEIANAALFLASDEASFITGSSLVIDGGYTSQ
tara:strand:+ start:1149 stop:1922 length:774 start_codon:yes stop_codon:yes gene_type:complete